MVGHPDVISISIARNSAKSIPITNDVPLLSHIDGGIGDSSGTPSILLSDTEILIPFLFTTP